MTARLFHMADTESRPPVVLEYTVSWPGVNGGETDTFEIPRDEWDKMTPAERYQRCDDMVESRAADLVGWGWHISDPDDYAATEESR